MPYLWVIGLCVFASGAAAAPVHKGWIRAAHHFKAWPLYGHNHGLPYVSSDHHQLGTEHIPAGSRRGQMSM